MIVAITALFVFQLLGEVVVQYLGLPLPGPLAGMLILLGVFIVRGGIPAELDRTGTALLQHLMLLFIPTVTGIMLFFDRIAEEWLPFIVGNLLASALTVFCTAFVLKKLMAKKADKEQP